MKQTYGVEIVEPDESNVAMYSRYSNVFYVAEFCALTFLRVKAVTVLVHLSHRKKNLSVCLSHGWISQNRCKLGHQIFMAWKSLVSGSVKLFHKFKTSDPERRS